MSRPAIRPGAAPVDVLAVMRAAVMVTESHGLNETAWGLSDACAAVAELVEAARGLADEVRKMERPWHLSGGAEEYGFDAGKSNAAGLVEKNLRAALAKFGGAA